MKTQLLHLIFVPALVLLGISPSISQTTLQDAQRLLQEKATELQLHPGDFDCLQLKNQYESRLSGVRHSYLAQCYAGIEVYNAIFNIHFTKEGALLHWGSRLVPDLEANIQGTEPGITAAQAVEAAAQQLGYAFQQALVVKETPGGAGQEVIFHKGDLSAEDIPVRLMYQPMPDGTVRLAWDLNLYQHDGQHWWSVRVDAQTGLILHQNDWVVSCDFGHPPVGSCDHHHDFAQSGTSMPNLHAPALVGVYNVYPQPVESPSHGGRQLISDPEDLTASPFGWHDTDGVPGAEFTITRGNNVYAQLDDDNDNSTFGFAPDGGPGLVFDFPIDLTQPPASYVSAAITNLFYWNNYMHDHMYGYGFDEAGGNFQQNNYGNGGMGSDYVIADAQDAGGINNANFATPPDGTRPRMQMYLWNLTTPNRDGDLDNGIIAHEYGHGISIRQTGGPSNSGCLNNTEQMGEGWSDYYSLMTTIEPGDQGADGRGIGTYAIGQPPTGNGIRPTPYSTDMVINPSTYNSIISLAAPHGVGYVWCTMIWEMTWGIIAQDGMAAGYDVAMNLVNEGLKLQPCSPGFVDGRDAILAADLALYGGAHTCTIWTAFAKRGLGFSASQGSSTSKTDGTEAFDMPPTCTLEALPASVSICQPDTAFFVVKVGPGNGNVTLSAVAGVPPGAVVNFSVNPVPPSDSSIMAISSTGVVLPGTYVITVEGVGSFDTLTTEVTLTVHATPPVVPVLLLPANLATGVGLRPTLEWTAAAGADGYTLEVATDTSFNDVVETATPPTGMHTLTMDLLPLTTYYWRVKAQNSCGESLFAPLFTFTTGEVTCNTSFSANVPVTIPGNAAATITSTLNIPGSGDILDVNVIGLDITHTWINDLIISVTSPQGTTVTIMSQPCGSQDNILINFDDEAASPNFPCPPTNNGFYQPFSPLSAFDGENLNGTWTLTVQDVFAQDGGTLNGWGLEFCYVPEPPLTNPSACQLNLPLQDDNCPVNDVFPINVDMAPGTSLGTDVIVSDVNLIIGHTWTADLDIYLVSPNGVIVELSTDNGGSGDNYGNPNDTTCTQVTNFNMLGVNGAITAGTAPFIGSYIPEGNFADFNDGSSPIGLWELRICDDTGSDVGNLQYVAIEFETLCTPVLWYEDADNDGFGNPGISTMACTVPPGHVADNTDCDDTNPEIYPGAPEICNGVDDDCSGSPEAASNTWTGNGDGSTWSDPENWSDGIVPLTCQDVIIVNGNNVTVPTSFHAVGKTLDVQQGGAISTGTGATLEIVD